MRLIDADALCERIRKIYDGYMLDEGCTPIEFENMVDEQPTAYDVDAVVKELEDSVVCGMFGARFGKSDTEIIDIIKAGGVK